MSGGHVDEGRLRRAAEEYVHKCPMCNSGAECQDDLCYQFRTALAAPLSASEAQPPDTRTIQQVLKLHIASSESMESTYRNTANSDMVQWQEGFTEGLKRAIEVADNMPLLGAQPPARRDAQVDLSAAFEQWWCAFWGDSKDIQQDVLDSLDIETRAAVAGLTKKAFNAGAALRARAADFGAHALDALNTHLSIACIHRKGDPVVCKTCVEDFVRNELAPAPAAAPEGLREIANSAFEIRRGLMTSRNLNIKTVDVIKLLDGILGNYKPAALAASVEPGATEQGTKD